MRELVSLEPSVRAALSAAAREDMSAHFGADAVAGAPLPAPQQLPSSSCSGLCAAPSLSAAAGPNHLCAWVSADGRPPGAACRACQAEAFGAGEFRESSAVFSAFLLRQRELLPALFLNTSVANRS